MSQVQSCHALEILDSRGNPTLEVFVQTSEGLVAKAAVPSGASTGSQEALEWRDQDPKRYQGKGVLQACAHVEGPLAECLRGMSIFDQEGIDRAMIALDGTENKRKFGANALLGVSLAVAKAAALTKQEPLYRSLGGEGATILPCPMMNILNGGAHANNGLSIQEFMICPAKAPSFREALRWGAEIFHTLKALLQERGFSTAVGDEGGFAPPLSSPREALDLILEAIEKAGYCPGKEVFLALDCAASEFFQNGVYRDAQGTRTSREQVDMLVALAQHYPIYSIEDGLAETDWEGWHHLTHQLGDRLQIVGDDLFATHASLLQKGIDQHVANAILIKVNQVGTLSETVDTLRLAKKHHYARIFSHRSGETEDATLADLAVAYSTGQIKTGSLSRSDRIAKYNRLLEIEKELGSRAQFFCPSSCN